MNGTNTQHRLKLRGARTFKTYIKFNVFFMMKFDRHFALLRLFQLVCQKIQKMLLINDDRSRFYFLIISPQFSFHSASLFRHRRALEPLTHSKRIIMDATINILSTALLPAALLSSGV